MPRVWWYRAAVTPPKTNGVVLKYASEFQMDAGCNMRNMKDVTPSLDVDEFVL